VPAVFYAMKTSDKQHGQCLKIDLINEAFGNTSSALIACVNLKLAKPGDYA